MSSSSEPRTEAASEVPPGREGADSGATDGVRIDESEAVGNDDTSPMNDIPGVGLRGADGQTSTDDDPDAHDRAAEEDPAQVASPDPTQEGEAAGTAHHLDRVITRDAAEPVRAVADPAQQDRPRLEQNDASPEDEIEGIVAQTRADFPDEPVDRAADVLRQRFRDSGIDKDQSEIDALAERVVGD